MGIVVDTSILIQLERRDVWPQSIGEALGRHGEIFVAAVTVSEMIAGALLSDSSVRQTRREFFLEETLVTVPVIPFTVVEARVHARLYVALRRAGTPVGERDLMIAATAMANGHAVMTNNVREFERIPGLEVLKLPLGPAS